MSLSLGKKISELRKEKGITQEELADKLGVSPQAVSKWENDLSCPDIMSLPDIADIFGITIDELFGKTKQKLTLQPSDQRKKSGRYYSICKHSIEKGRQNAISTSHSTRESNNLYRNS